MNEEQAVQARRGGVERRLLVLAVLLVGAGSAALSVGAGSSTTVRIGDGAASEATTTSAPVVAVGETTVGTASLTPVGGGGPADVAAPVEPEGSVPEAPAVDPAPPAGGPVLATATDTGVTRARIELVSQAAWLRLTLEGVSILASRTVETTGSAHPTAVGGNLVSIDGTGTVTIDVVLAVPRSAAPAIAVCKNYLGPATVTVLRTTDGSTLVARHDSTGTDPAASGGCENPTRFDLARADLVGPTRWPARLDPRPLVLANYYPWYGTGAPPDLRDRPTGPVSTADPVVVDQAIELATASGIDGFVVEYEGSPIHDPDLDEVFAAADRHPGFQSALMLDFDIIGNREGWTGPGVIDDVMGAVQRYSAHPGYLRVDGMPVVFLYGTGRLDPQQWAAGLDRFRAATGTPLFVVTDGTRVAGNGLYAYSTNTIRDAATLAAWGEATLLERILQPALVDAARPLWVAPVSPGYDDTALGRAHPIAIDRAGGERYEQSWRAATSTLPEWIMVTTWNEYFEQTHVVPGSRSGSIALEQTARWQDWFRRNG